MEDVDTSKTTHSMQVVRYLFYMFVGRRLGCHYSVILLTRPELFIVAAWAQLSAENEGQSKYSPFRM
jgi:hypothetical protein